MNHAYRDNVPAPHIHWWAVPRYRQTVMIKDCCFDDPDFGNPYDHGRWVEVPKVVHQEIGKQIRNAL
jgi:hypothetical protein